MNSDQWLRTLYNSFFTYLYQIAVTILQTHLGHAADVQDVLQDVFLIAAVSDKLPTYANPRAWLYKTTFNVCMNYIRGTLRRDLRNHQYAKKTYASISHPACRSHADACITRLSIEQTLSATDWQLLRHYTLENVPIEQLAREAGLSVNALHVKIYRIRKMLKENQIDM